MRSPISKFHEQLRKKYNKCIQILMKNLVEILLM